MTFAENLEVTANIFSILTFFGGVGAWLFYRYEMRQKRIALEERLKLELEVGQKNGKQGEVGFLHLTTKTGLTETEILQASFKNPRINRLEKLDAEGFAAKILFQYNDKN